MFQIILMDKNGDLKLKKWQKPSKGPQWAGGDKFGPVFQPKWG